ncbi:hypothetical protein DRW42_09625 [Pedobacter miscanthi]|uniref:Uncharacterized protein n=1 Tax=Pedobacter miscanthi TaxID=2259170 RepID=A0A366L3H0_9SPHI|nr:hypothetical protein DRW42_09625 [Pedobacter miscanthi]
MLMNLIKEQNFGACSCTAFPQGNDDRCALSKNLKNVALFGYRQPDVVIGERIPIQMGKKTKPFYLLAALSAYQRSFSVNVSVFDHGQDKHS